MRVQRLAVALVAIQCSLVFGGLLYRATVYESIPVAPGDPYGLGDVLELLLYFVLLGSSALTLLTALLLSVVPSLRNWRAVAALIGAGLLALPVYFLLHTYAARLSLRALFPATSAVSAPREEGCPPQRWAVSR